MVSVFKLLCLQIWIRKSGSLTIRAVPGSCSSITLADFKKQRRYHCRVVKSVIKVVASIFQVLFIFICVLTGTKCSAESVETI